MRVAELESVRSIKRNSPIQQPQKSLRPVTPPNIGQSKANSGRQIQTPKGFIVEQSIFRIVRR